MSALFEFTLAQLCYVHNVYSPTKQVNFHLDNSHQPGVRKIFKNHSNEAAHTEVIFPQEQGDQSNKIHEIHENDPYLSELQKQGLQSGMPGLSKVQKYERKQRLMQQKKEDMGSQIIYPENAEESGGADPKEKELSKIEIDQISIETMSSAPLPMSRSKSMFVSDSEKHKQQLAALPEEFRNPKKDAQGNDGSRTNQMQRRKIKNLNVNQATKQLNKVGAESNGTNNGTKGILKQSSVTFMKQPGLPQGCSIHKSKLIPQAVTLEVPKELQKKEKQEKESPKGLHRTQSNNHYKFGPFELKKQVKTLRNSVGCLRPWKEDSTSAVEPGERMPALGVKMCRTQSSVEKSGKDKGSKENEGIKRTMSYNPSSCYSSRNSQFVVPSGQKREMDEYFGVF